MRKSMAPWAALAGFLALTLAAAALVRSSARMRGHAHFARAQSEVQDRILARLQTDAALLGGVAALLAAHPDTSAEQFHSYVERLDLAVRQPGLQGVGFARRLRRTESAQVEADLQSRGFAGMRIWPDAGREERSAIVWLEPLERRNRAAIGYDMSTEPTRREAMERARDTGAAALSGKVKLVQEIDVPQQAGFLLYVPVYRGNTVPTTVAKRREALAGWACSPFRAGDLLSGIFGGESDPLVDFQVYDGPQADPARLLRDSRVPPQPGALTETQQMGFAGREWTLAFIALPALETGSLAPAAATLLGGLFVVSLLLFRLAWLEVRARVRAEEAVGELRRLLEERRVNLPGATSNANPIEVLNVSPRAAYGRVLVVDDNVDAASTLAEAVRLDGHEVRVAHDGPDALAQADGFAPQVVLLDIGRPGMDGYEVVRLLRQRPQLRGTLMVALTGFGQESDRERALGAGFDEHLIKPVDLDTVHAVLRRRLGAA